MQQRPPATYAGPVPKQHISGSSVHRKTRVSKTGNARLSKALYCPAIVAKRHNPFINPSIKRR
ncbi:MAG: transposase [Deltaproteobacteria bacterium]|nr:transposase [Deltaproteobacteria bacterium]